MRPTLRPVMRRIRRLKWLGFFGFLGVSIVLLAAAFAPINFPNWSATVSPAATTTSCSSTFSNPVISSTSTGGVAQFGCGPNPAFTVLGAGSDTATFTLPTLLTGTGSVDSLGYGPTCSSQTLLVSGGTVALVPGNYFLCVSFTITSGTASFTGGSFSWSS